MGTKWKGSNAARGVAEDAMSRKSKAEASLAEARKRGDAKEAQLQRELIELNQQTINKWA